MEPPWQPLGQRPDGSTIWPSLPLKLRLDELAFVQKAAPVAHQNGLGAILQGTPFAETGLTAEETSTYLTRMLYSIWSMRFGKYDQIDCNRTRGIFDTPDNVLVFPLQLGRIAKAAKPSMPAWRPTATSKQEFQWMQQEQTKEAREFLRYLDKESLGDVALDHASFFWGPEASRRVGMTKEEAVELAEHLARMPPESHTQKKLSPELLKLWRGEMPRPTRSRQALAVAGVVGVVLGGAYIISRRRKRRRAW